MIVLAIEEFTAKRKNDQTDMEKTFYPHVAQAIEAYPAEDWYDDLLAHVARTYLDVFHQEGGTGLPTPPAASFTAEVKATLDKTEKPTQATVDRISVWLATATLNAGTQAAAADDEEFLLMEWVTMHDDDVRPEHKATAGQQRPTNEPFDVAGTEMRYPGDPKAPIELWINCRCSLAPVLGSEAASLQTEGVTMTATETEPEAVETGAPLAWHGILAPEGVWSGDGRQFAPDALRFRDLPLPLTWQKATDAGHDGSIVVGKIVSIDRVDGMMQASGTFLQTPEADEVVGLLAEFGKFGVSVDADDAEFEFNEQDGKVTFTSARIASASIVSIPAFAEAYITLGQRPDFLPTDDAPVDDVCDPESDSYDEAACKAKKDTADKPPAYASSVQTMGRGPGWLTNPADTKRLHDYWTKPGHEGYEKIGWGTPNDFYRCRDLVGEEIAENSPEDMIYLNQICSQWHHDALGYWPGQEPLSTNGSTFTTISTTSSGPITFYNSTGTVAPAITLVAGGGRKAPAAWFTNPNLTGPTHLQVTEEGRVFGHIAEWSACHIGYEGVCVAPPHSETDYAYFATGKVLLDNGGVASTGVISLGEGHANGSLRPRAAIAHYDSTSAAVADVMVGEDDYGIWCSGWVRPGTSEEQIIALRASDVSGDWREVRPGGELELVAALACNVGGFPTVGVAGGVQISLVAAGMVQTEVDDAVEVLAEEIEKRLVARTERRNRMKELATRSERRERMKALAARVEGV